MMAEKRFTYMEQFNGFCDVYDNGKILSCMRLEYVENTVNLLNELYDENKELKSDNDIKFWKLQFIRFYNSNGIIMHELGKAIEEGYEVSNEFKQYLHDLKVQNEKNVEKAKRLGI